MAIQALREQRAVHAKTLNDLMKATEGKTFTAENQAAYDAGIAAIDQIDAEIKRHTDVNARIAEDAMRENVIEAANKHDHDKRSPQAKAFVAWLRAGERGLSAEDALIIRNTMSVGTGSQGGFTVPTETATTLIEKLKQFGGMRTVSSVLATETGHPMSFPAADTTSEVGELVAENAATSALDTSFSTIGLPVYKYSSKYVTVPYELLQDSNIDIEAYVNALIVRRIGRITNTHYTVGTGSGQPQGVVTGAPIGYTAGNGGSEVTAVKYDSLIELQHSIDPAYRQAGQMRWMFADSTLKVVRKIKDSQSRPIFVPGYEMGSPEGSPDRLLGAPIQINQDIAPMGAGALSIVYGDFTYYTIRDAMDVMLRRFDDSAFASKGQVGFLAFMRSGGALLDVGGAVKTFQNAAS